MDENGSTTSKMLEKNWVLKRKRRKIPPNLGTSSSKENSSKSLEPLADKSSKCRLKTEILSDNSSSKNIENDSSKKMGNDGYYFECVVCDVGGNLLCCESCPCTYHMECLDPPLQNVPDGRWECPRCRQKNDSFEPIDHLDTITKRSRTKIIIKKPKDNSKSPGTMKSSEIFEGSLNGKKRSSGKEKSSLSHLAHAAMRKRFMSSVDVSCDAKPNRPAPGSPIEGSSLNVDGDEEKKSEPPTPVEKVPKLAAKKMPKANDVSPDGNHDFSASDTTPENKPADKLDAATRKDRKRKHKVYDIDFQKRQRTDKGKCSSKSSKKHGSKLKAPSIGTCKLRRKQKTVDHATSADLLKEELDKDFDEIAPEEATRASNEARRSAVAPPIYEDYVQEVLQVDRVLGCRVRGDETDSSRNTSFAGKTDLPVMDSLIQEDENNLDEEFHACDMPSSEVGTGDLGEGSHNTVNHSDGGSNTEKEKNDEVRVYKRLVTKEGKKSSRADSTLGDNKASASTAGDDKSLGNSVDVKDSEEKTNGGSGQNTDFSMGSHDTNGSPKNCEATVCHDVGNKKEAPLRRKSKEKVLDSVLAESAPSDSVSISYEYLVKWVGKSNIHNSWVPESELKVLAKRKLDNFKAKYGTAIINICEERWKQPQRVMAIRSSAGCPTEVFVKWTGLPYDECSWERVVEPVVARSSHLIDLFNEFERVTVQKDAIRDNVKKKKGELQQKEVVTLIEQPKELKGGALFPHQLEALNWLRKCWVKSKNVILADEMGLGKTVSACAFITSLYFEFSATLPCLVLVPLSTMPNWMAEFGSWAPNLNVVEYHGSARARTTIREYEWNASNPSMSNKKTVSYKFNVLLTTYEMVLADSSYLRGVPWEVLVVDEGHRLKNSSSKLFGLLNTFSFQHRVLLTGTPLQNNIGEMYNLLNFLQPSSFPSLSSFEENFNELTTAEKVEELKKLVAPHMLRRLKKDAMQNIPPKTERMVPVELTSIQAEYYRAILTKNYQVLRNIGKGVAQQSMLNVVMQLRKVCNHPYLIPGTEPESGSTAFLQEMRIKASAKLALLHSMLKVLHKEGHRVLIFSQMTKLLDILEDYLTIEFGPKTFERVDGSVSVSDRQAAIVRFNQDRSRFVFLLSTRSCGLGINLATADTVIIYDSDFNPHADIQAMNRAHRIGQSKRLLVYRLVVRASVEERILQLAKKKLMLDQLFVNKSGSQKEVEDILRWGTEELFRDSSSIAEKGTSENHSNKIEVPAETEQKNRRRTGSLGDVYKDKCADGNNKIVWDDNAILKLLDRSILSDSPEAAEMESENDMLGSVKSLEWNDEPTEEQAGTVSPAVHNEDTSAQTGEAEDNLVGVTEENEWDKLLRVRWKKYQSEEEAALGRGKRLRKAVSYREAYAPHPSETLSESGVDEEPEPEPEPEREYTAAGRALKLKYTKLRERQKERLARRKEIEASAPVEGVSRLALPLYLLSSSQNGTPMTELLQRAEEKASLMNLDDNNCGQTSEGTRAKAETALRSEKIPKQKSLDHLAVLDKPTSQPISSNSLPNHHAVDSTNVNSEQNKLLPVLGLSAPRANLLESSSHRSFSRSYNRQNRHGQGLEFPSGSAPGSLSRTLSRMVPKGPETGTGRFKFPELSLEASQQQSKNNMSDTFPFNLHPPMPQGPVNPVNSGASFSNFQEKMMLPKLPFDDRFLPRYSFPGRDLPNPFPDLLPDLTLGSRTGDGEDKVPDLPPVPSLPNFKFPPRDMPLHIQPEPEMPHPPPHPASFNQFPQFPPPFSSFPDSHRKVLENIMLRTGAGTGVGPSNLLKRKSKMDDIWSEDELDYLWIGVRRHGRGNWDGILRDPKLRFSKFKTAEDLSARWEVEQLKILDGPAFPMPKPPQPTRSARSTLFSGISDGMLTRALHGGKFTTPTNFQSHLTDMKLGINDLVSGLPHLESPDQVGLWRHPIPPFPTWRNDKLQENFVTAGSSDRPSSSSNIPMEPPHLLEPLGPSRLGPLGRNFSSSFDVPESDQNGSKLGRLPVLEKQVSVSGNDTVSVEANKSLNLLSKGKEVVECSSATTNKLPHWLREAVITPAKSSESELPPSVSAIAQSVRLLYGQSKTAFPPFVTPAPTPPQPKDPRLFVKKKKKKQSFQNFKPSQENLAGTSINLEDNHGGNAALTEPNINVARENSATTSDPSPSLVHPLQRETTGTVSPSPEVVQFLASSAAPGLPPSAGSLEIVLPQTKTFDEARSSYSNNLHEKQSSAPGSSQSLQEKAEPTDSENTTSNTRSDADQLGCPEAEESSSSERTVSDHRSGDDNDEASS